jgi:hypothetical protein
MKRQFATRSAEMPDEAGGGTLFQGETRMATRLRIDIGFEGNREENVLPDYSEEYTQKYVFWE